MDETYQRRCGMTWLLLGVLLPVFTVRLCGEGCVVIEWSASSTLWVRVSEAVGASTALCRSAFF